MQCDYQRPQCGRCLRSGIVCEGYTRDLIFVVYDGPAPQLEPQIEEQQLMRSPVSIPMCPNNNRLDAFHSFLTQYLPEKPLLYELSLRWLQSLSVSQGRYRQLDRATDALGTVVLARSLNDNKALAVGMELYGKALAELRQGQLTENNWRGALMTAVVLQIYEAVESSAAAGDGWLRHSVGICSILENVGPAAVQEGAIHETFLCSRVSVTIGSIISEKPTLLAAPEWQSVPWAKMPKTHLHRLLDSVSQLPALLHASTVLSRRIGTSAQSNDQTVCFYRLRRDIDIAMDLWWNDLTTSRDGPLLWSRPSKDPSQQPFTEMLCYQKLTDAQMITFYCEARLHCHKAASRVIGNSYLPPNDGETKASETPFESLLHYADSICQSSIFMLGQEFGILGLHFTIMPLLAANHFYTEAGLWEKRDWCTRTLDRMASRPFSILSRN
ncbi:hypothetical protein QQS21_005506 [Conoideocrella luteorostrata]|uniref:Zn(2)-C6 fungal-type domain-containing protein n=1 Tax=Conoideocrella luteorostrata TaxID=1105319 RepID=A0AAJ0CSD6_9HYPO|nr:hypothetical protein QQS21_005506 [Conoideocrella luteorostrata]